MMLFGWKIRHYWSPCNGERGQMTHPLYLVKRHQQKVESGHYKAIAKEVEDTYRNADWAEHIDPYERLGQVYATKARLSDRLGLIQALVARATGVADNLSDDDAMAILVGWAAMGYRKFHE